MYSINHNDIIKNIAFFVLVTVFAFAMGTLLTYAEDDIEPVPEAVVQEALEQQPTDSTSAAIEAHSDLYTEIPSPIYPISEVMVNEDVLEENEDTSFDSPLVEPIVQSMVGETVSLAGEEPGSITITLDALPNNAQNFLFTNNFDNGNPSSFQLDDDSNAALQNTGTFSVAPGTYVVAQDAVSGWKLSSATCSNGSPVTAISVASGEHVTCTVINKKLGTITLIKKTIGGEGAFDFTMTGTSLPQNAQLVTQNASATKVFSNIDPESTYSIVEDHKVGWKLMSALCTRGTPDNFNLIATNLNITCTFENDYSTVPAEIRLIKETIPEGALDSFQFMGDIQNVIHDGDAPLLAQVEPGTYTTTEEKAAGWTMGAIHCDDADSMGNTGSGSITYKVDSGEVVTCAVTNIKDPSITIEGTDTNQIKEPHTFTVTVGQHTKDAFTPIADGTPVSVTISPFGYELVLDTCSTAGTQSGVCTVTINSNIPKVYEAHAEASVMIGGIAYSVKTDGTAQNSGDATMTYEAGNILVHKITEGGSAGFAFTASYDTDGFVLQGGESNDSGYLPLGTYSVSENTKDGWYQKSATCDNGDSPKNITLKENGDIVTCTFVNTPIPVASSHAQLTIEENTQPNNTKNFAFMVFQGTSSTAFILDDDAGVRHGSTHLSNTKVLSGLKAGTIAITELGHGSKWQLQNVSCTRSSGNSFVPVFRYKNTITLTLVSGDAVTCVFTNAEKKHAHKDKGHTHHK